ncbi:hypothetical protein HPB48_022117 [Haemaphysalis longicornis]|uniref:Uncharacterized protein n=1 Tax=Haemaphysalis longicornis TaxID=44386 RepID=A0A9J6H584_HAELO|nr:hypothetical protein HPB48_022117 [Haemaphysalis longicornis]
MFSSLHGVSLHRRKRHFDEYNASIGTTRVKARWSDEEEHLLASYEASLARSGAKNLNARLAEKFKDRTLDAIKSHRKSERYQALVSEIRARLEADANPPSTRPKTRRQQQGAGTSRPAEAPEPVEYARYIPEQPEDTRAAIVKELRSLVRKPPPQGYEDPRLWEIVKRQLEGQNVDRSSGKCYRRVIGERNVNPGVEAGSSFLEQAREQQKSYFGAALEQQKSNFGAGLEQFRGYFGALLEHTDGLKYCG